MERRTLGHTGVELSTVGMGGIVVTDTTPEEAQNIVAEAVDRGVNYFDVAPSYGNAQERLGPALESRRNEVFLACKTGRRDAAGAQDELENSLRMLRTDHFDLYQLHALSSVQEVETVFGAGGAMEVFTRAKQAGTVRFLGFSAHSEEAALHALELFPFDSVLFPINFVLYDRGEFGPRIMEAAERSGAGRLALKAMARGPWPEGVERSYPKCWYQPLSNPDLARLALRFTLSLPVTAAIPPGHLELFRLAMDIADGFTPLADAEHEILRNEARELGLIFKKAA